LPTCTEDAQGTADKVLMLADGSGEFTAAAGMELDLTKAGLGTRSQRYAAILQDGVVQEIFVEPKSGKVDVASSDKILKAL
jgi:peroxiredoxin